MSSTISREQHRRRPRWRQIARWVSPLGRNPGLGGFVLNRVAGLGLVVYLMIHLAVLTLLAQGPQAWDAFIRLAKTPLFLGLDVILIAGIVGHGLNGLRVALIGSGLLVRWQRLLLAVLGALGAVILAAAAILIFGK